MNLTIKVFDARGQAIHVVSLNAFPVRIGRDPYGELPLEHALFPMVSKLHATIELVDSGLHIVPKSATNITLLNDQIISVPSPVKKGDRVRLGMTGPTLQILDLL